MNDWIEVVNANQTVRIARSKLTHVVVTEQNHGEGPHWQVRLHVAGVPHAAAYKVFHEPKVRDAFLARVHGGEAS